MRQQVAAILAVGGGEVRADSPALAVKLVAGGAVLGEEHLAARRVAFFASQSRIEPCDACLLLAGRRGGELAEVLLDECGHGLVVELDCRSRVVDRDVGFGDTSHYPRPS